MPVGGEAAGLKETHGHGDPLGPGERYATAAEDAADDKAAGIGAAPDAKVQPHEDTKAKLKEAREVLLRHFASAEAVDALEVFIRAVK